MVRRCSSMFVVVRHFGIFHGSSLFVVVRRCSSTNQCRTLRQDDGFGPHEPKMFGLVWGGQNGSKRPEMAHGTPHVGFPMFQSVPLARRLLLKVDSTRWAGISLWTGSFWATLGLLWHFQPLGWGQWGHFGLLFTQNRSNPGIP